MVIKYEIMFVIWAIIPVAGLINHIDASLKNVEEEWDDENQFYIIYAFRDIPAKSEIRFHYFEPNEKNSNVVFNMWFEFMSETWKLSMILDSFRTLLETKLNR